MLGNGFLPMFAGVGGAPANPWTGATWALDGSGRAYNTPTLGAELLANGGMEAWASATNLQSWSETVTGSSSINQESGIVRSGSFAARVDIDAANASAYISQGSGQSVGAWLQVNWWLRTSASGKTFRFASGTTLGPARDPGPIWVNYTDCYRILNAGDAGIVPAFRVSSASSSAYVDDVSAKVVSLPTTIATVAGTSATQTAAAKIATLTTGTQAGVVSLLALSSSPANFLIAYHDGSNVRLDKCVAGTYTSLVSTAVAFSASAQIEIRRPSGNTFQLWYNGTQRGADQTVADTGIISNTRYGLFSTYSGNTFSEFSLGGVVIPFALPGA